MLATKEAGKALAQALASNSTLKELDVSDNWEGGDGPGFAQELAIGIKDNGALTSLDLASNRPRAEGANIATKATEVTVPLRSFWHPFHVHLATG